MNDHNPENLTHEQVGVSEGWRLLQEDEVQNPRVEKNEIEMWLPVAMKWNGWAHGNCTGATYRTRLTRAELRAARGLPPIDEAVSKPLACPKCGYIMSHISLFGQMGCAQCGYRDFPEQPTEGGDVKCAAHVETPTGLTAQSTVSKQACNAAAGSSILQQAGTYGEQPQPGPHNLTQAIEPVSETPQCEFCELDGFGDHAPRCPVHLEMTIDELRAEGESYAKERAELEKRLAEVTKERDELLKRPAHETIQLLMQAVEKQCLATAKAREELAELTTERDLLKETNLASAHLLVQCEKQRDKLREEVGECLTRIAKSEEEIAGMRKDKERLDWLQKDGCLKKLFCETSISLKSWADGTWEIREAIDAAMKGAK